MSFLISMVRDKLTTIPPQEQDCTGRTIVITGANTGIGLEAARHFTRLNAARVIIGCRNLDKGEQARKDIQETTGRHDVVEVWQLDLASFDSVREFAAQVNKLERVDALINNASLLTFKREIIEGHESMLTVNVISTALLSLLTLAALRRTATRFNVAPHVVIVSSDAAYEGRLPVRESNNIIEDLDAQTLVLERYSETKLLQAVFVERLAEDVDVSGQGRIIINAVHPGFCSTELFRNVPFPFSLIFTALIALLSRTPEMGSRALLAGTFAGDELHGKMMFNGELHKMPKTMQGEDGNKLTRQVWEELLELLEGIEPGVTKNI
ncbi:hypothetical protein NW762_011822 [Fusarium torreyae]|uniref:Uncharacterized protein n=1 Tax=Fusarium torreyae TaxID=1237075 RepID=A0A9W8RQ74_9HYPO|nr:hypothetical protein NW762_011822 [Fusarium torreyae]